MPRIQYEARRFSKKSQDLIEQANSIIEEYAAQGFILILRQLYHQFVTRVLLPNEVRAYKRLGSVVNDARLAGLIDWDAIEDRTRNLQTLSCWESPQDILVSAAESYRIDRWVDQPVRFEVWIEKEALVGVIEPVCNEFRVPYFACRGYNSQSEMWRAGQRLAEYWKHGQVPIVQGSLESFAHDDFVSSSSSTWDSVSATCCMASTSSSTVSP